MGFICKENQKTKMTLIEIKSQNHIGLGPSIRRRDVTGKSEIIFTTSGYSFVQPIL